MYFKTRSSLLRIQRQRGLERIKQFEKSLGETYQLGDSEDSSDASVDDNRGMWNVVEVNGVSLLQLGQDDSTYVGLFLYHFDCKYGTI